MTNRRRRVDEELVRRHLAPSVRDAAELISQRRVLVGGFPAGSPHSLVTPADAINVSAPPPRYVSRGGEKLDAALLTMKVDVTGRSLDVSGRECLDVGASTGGFTDCLLQHGAVRVVAIDSGRAQLHDALTRDVRDRSLARTVTRDPLTTDFVDRPSLVVADVSFCGLVHAIAPAVVHTDSAAEFLLLVKPQFEASKAEMEGSGGVVRDPALWSLVLDRVTSQLIDIGLAPVGWCLAEPPGPKGNREFFVRARRFSAVDGVAVAIREARAQGEASVATAHGSPKLGAQTAKVRG